MNIIKGGLIGALSALLTILIAYLFYTSSEGMSGMAKLCGIVLSGLVIGAAQGFFIEPSWHRTIGIGTFTGALILLLPVVLVTYGFALIGLPLLAAFSMLVRSGAKLGNTLRMFVRRPK